MLLLGEKHELSPEDIQIIIVDSHLLMSVLPSDDIYDPKSFNITTAVKTLII